LFNSNDVRLGTVALSLSVLPTMPIKRMDAGEP
jgi:hypothetical protein